MEQSSPASGLGRFLRRVFLSKPFLIGALLVLFYSLSGFFLAPYLIKRQLKGYVTENLARQLSVREIRLNPYTLTLNLSGFALREVDGQPLISFNRLFVNFELKSLYRLAWTFAEISLNRPVLSARIKQDGVLNLSKLFEDAMQGDSRTEAIHEVQEEKGDPLPRIYIERVKLTDGRVDISDFSDQTPAETTLEPFNLEVKDLTTIPQRRGSDIFKASLPQGGVIEWAGEITLQPLWSKGKVTIRDAKIMTPWLFFQDELNLEEPKGIANFEVHYRLSYAQNSLQLTVDQFQALITDLSLTLTGTEGPTLALEKIEISDGSFDLASRELIIENLDVSRGSVFLAVDEHDRLNLKGLVTEGRTSSEVTGAGEQKPEHPLDVQLKKVTVSDVNVNYADRSRAEPIDIAVGGLNLEFLAHLEQGRETIGLIDHIAIDIPALSIKQVGEKETLLTVQGIGLSDGQVNLASRDVKINNVVFKKGKIALWRDPEGTINWVRLSGSRGKGAVSRKLERIQTEAAAEGERWSVFLANIGLEQFAVDISDRGLKSSSVYKLKNFRMNLRDFSNDPKSTFSFKLATDLAEGGSAEATGKVNVHKPSAEAIIRADKLALMPLNPYLGSVARLSLD
ncbi:DUF748 domain-containing protein, partial [Thermodesulfobacteriota bacterium]